MFQKTQNADFIDRTLAFHRVPPELPSGCLSACFRLSPCLLPVTSTNSRHHAHLSVIYRGCIGHLSVMYRKSVGKTATMKQVKVEETQDRGTRAPKSKKKYF